MDALIRFGFTIEEIQSMMDSNEDVMQIEDSELNGLIHVLEGVGCSSSCIKNILICNPFYLTRSLSSTKKLIQKFYNLGFSSLYVLFDSNPYILNMSDTDIEEFFHKKINEGLTKEEVLDFIQYNMFC